MASLWLSFESLSPSSVMTMEAISKKGKLQPCGASESSPYGPRVAETARVQTMGAASAVMRLHGAHKEPAVSCWCGLAGDNNLSPARAQGRGWELLCSWAPTRLCCCQARAAVTLLKVPVKPLGPGLSVALNDNFEKQMVFLFERQWHHIHILWWDLTQDLLDATDWSLCPWLSILLSAQDNAVWFIFGESK